MNLRLYLLKCQEFCLILSIFFLPNNLNLNNIFLVFFILLSLPLIFLNKEISFRNIVNKHWPALLITTIPFCLNAFGLIYSDELKQGFNYLVRAVPFLFLPMIAFIKPEFFIESYKKLGYALVVGCVVSAFYSWGFSIIEIWQLKKPIKELLGPLYSHHNLLKSLDLHAAYLSIFIYTAIGFLVIEFKKGSKKWRSIFIVTILVLTAFMFHLLSRNAIMYYLLSSIVFLIYFKYWKILISGVFIVFILGFLAYNIKHNYLRDRLFKSLNIFEKETQFSKKDDRFDRLAASYEIFKQSPIFGYGTAAESKYRKQIYLHNKDIVAYENNYNAHNQFFEYLSTYGILGGLAYLIFFGYLFNLVVRQKNAYFLFLVTGLFFACLTESVFERSNGIVYASMLIALILSFKTERRINIDAY